MRRTSLRFVATVILCLAGALFLPTRAAHAAYTSGHFLFDKSTASPYGTISWRYHIDDGAVEYSAGSWRSGAGTGTNPCVKNVGWLPNGFYTSWGHYQNYNGTSVRGRVWRISDKACPDGTLRTELFIHSEQTSDNRQVCQPGVDVTTCWEGDGDYRSNGCIKLHPTSIAQAHDVQYPKGGIPYTETDRASYLLVAD